MLKQTVSIGIWSAYRLANRPIVNPRKPGFSMAKTKEKLDRFFEQNEAIRKLCEENKYAYPRMHQSVQHTAWKLLMYYMKNWGKSTARNYEIRITHTYLRQALNNSCCVATLKNHINKLLRMYKGFLKTKYRGGLGLSNQNTACIVLVIDPQVLQFDDERHNEAVRVGELSAEQSRRKQAENVQQQRHAAQSILSGHSMHKDRNAKGQAAPAPLADLLKDALRAIPKRE